MTAASRFAGIHVLADDDPRWKPDPVEQAQAACAGGAAVVQLRAKHAPDRAVLAWARAIREATRQRGVAFVVNDRFDLALAAEADAVHLGRDDLPPSAVPERIRAALPVGLSSHDAAQAREAAEEDPAYVAFGPLFGTTSKDSPFSARGLDALAEVVRAVAPRPVVAIGGIGEDQLEDIAAAGAAGAAVISAVAGASDPEDATRRLVRAFDAARSREDP